MDKVTDFNLRKYITEFIVETKRTEATARDIVAFIYGKYHIRVAPQRVAGYLKRLGCKRKLEEVEYKKIRKIVKRNIYTYILDVFK